MSKSVKCLVGGLASTLIMILTSTLIHGVIFHEVWEEVSFMRPTDQWPFIPGVPIATLIWNMIIAWFFIKIHRSIPGEGFGKGVRYGLYLCVLFVFFVELWNWLQFKMSFMTVAAGILTYMIALPLGGGVISVIYGHSPEEGSLNRGRA